MEVQHLLLLALVGPFCALARAGPTIIPTNTGLTETADFPPGTSESPAVLSGPPLTDPTAVPNLSAEPSLLPTTVDIDTTAVVATDIPDAPSTKAPEYLTSVGPLEETTVLGEVFISTVAEPKSPTQEAPPPAEETPEPSGPVEPEEQTEATVDTLLDVAVEDGSDIDGLSSGQIIGIVIGALLAVVIVIAVVIAVVRRMGKYSP